MRENNLTLSEKRSILREKRSTERTVRSGVLLGIFFICASAVCLLPALRNIIKFSSLLVSVCFIKGFSNISVSFKRRKRSGFFWIFSTISGVSDMAFGILFALFNTSGHSINAVLLSVWILIGCFEGIVNAGYFKKRNKKKFIIHLISNFLGIILGSSLLLNSNNKSIALSVVAATYFLIIGLSVFFVSLKNTSHVKYNISGQIR